MSLCWNPLFLVFLELFPGCRLEFSKGEAGQRKGPGGPSVAPWGGKVGTDMIQQGK